MPTTMVGSQVQCGYEVTGPTLSGDIITVTSIVDVSANAGGPTTSPNLLLNASFIADLGYTGGATCVIGSCTIPYLGTVFTTSDFGWYTATAADYGLSTHTLNDEVTSTATYSACGPAGGCPITPQTENAGGTTTVTPAPTDTVTTVRQSGSAVTSVALGSSVTFTFFTNGTCAPTGTAGSPMGLNASGVANSASSGALTTVGSYSYQGHLHPGCGLELHRLDGRL